MNETHCSELAPAKRGPKPSPNALKFKSVGLKPEDWEYVFQFATPEEREAGNPTPAINRLADMARRFMPGGEQIGKPRLPNGQFAPGDGTSKTAQGRRRRRERKEAEQCP